MANLLPKGLAALVTRFRRSAEEVEVLPERETSSRAALWLHEVRPGLLQLGSTVPSMPLFSVRARRTGRFQEEDQVFTIPLEGSAIKVRLEGTPADGGRLVRSTRTEGVLEFTAAADGREWTWRFELDPGLSVSDVAAPEPPPSLFPQVPSVAEMAGFLHSLTHEKRSMPRTLQSVARTSLNSSTGEVVAHVVHSWPSAGGSPNPAIAVLAGAFERCGRRVNPDSLEAFCLLVDIERGRLTAPDVDRALEEKGHVPASAEAALATADLFGVVLDEGLWNDGLRALGDYEVARAAADGPEVQRIVRHLRSEQRTVLDILEDLGRDSGSPRVVAMVQALRPLVPQGLLRVNDEQQALLPLLEASGRRVHPQTLIALCLFVDIEAGILTLELAPRLAGEADQQDSSMYAMMAAAGAFGMPLQAWCLEGEAAAAPLPVLAQLTSRSEGGLLACFRKRGEAGRWWEWIRSEANLSQAWGMDFTGIVLARLDDPSGLPLRPVEAEQLHGAGESLSREFLAMRKLQEAVRRVVPRPVDRDSLRRRPEALEAALEWLSSPRAGALLEGMVHPDTRRLLVQEVRREIGRDFLVFRAVARASPEILGLHLLLALCLSAEVELQGCFKQFDEKRIRALLAERMDAMLESEDPAQRALGVTLSASRDHVPDRATRMLVEYHLAVARQDPEAAVAEAALDGLVRLALMDVQPLPRVVDVAATSPDALAGPEEGGASRLQGPVLDQAVADLEEWLSLVAQGDALRPMGLPITDAQGRLDPGRARPVAEVLAGLQQATLGDGSLKSVRVFALSSLDELSAMAGAMLESWRLVARAVSRPLVELDPEAMALEHRLLVEEQAARLLHRWGALPHLGGRGRPVTLYKAGAGRGCGIWCLVERLPGQVAREESPFFRDLLELYRRVEGSRLRVLRLRFRGGLPEELAADRPSLQTEFKVDLRDLEVLDPGQVAFIPFVRLMELSREPLGLAQEPWGEVRAVAALAEGRRPEPAAEEAPQSPSPAGPPCDAEALQGVADSLGRVLELDAARRSEVVGLLEEAMAGCGSG